LAVVAIAGTGRGAGKTAVACALIAAMPERRWVAVKVSPHRHGLPPELTPELTQETEPESQKDTGRYLRAGATASFWIPGANSYWKDELVELLREVSRLAPEANAWIVESGRIDRSVLAAVLGPVLSLAVLGADVKEWKPSTSSWQDCADALVLAGGLSREQLPQELQGMRSFQLPPGEWLTGELLKFVREGSQPR